MQSQHYNVPPHSGYYNAAQNSYPTSQDQYTASNVGDFASFSRGSSLVYPQDYQYFSDRGTPSRHSTNFADSHSTDTAVPGFTENSSPGVDMSYRPEDILAYQQSWQWNDTTMHDSPVPITGPMYSSADVVKNPVDYSFMDVSTPVAHLPTPAMAIMLSQNSQADVRNHPQISYQEPSSQISTQTSAAVARTSRTESGPGLYAVPDSQLREKKHACTMCHKRFDRPSTLRKHFLVHTGEKAFVCETCGRRFGVASNLNRHARKCILKPIHNASASSNDSTSGSPSAHSVSPVPSNSSQPQTSSTSGQSSKRVRDAACSPDHFVQLAAHGGQPTGSSDVKPMMQKRRRRAPPPSQWIPYSLSHFNLSSEELQKATPVPLPPVRRCLPREERDSWDENVNATPYHPRGWKNVLPGPGLGIFPGLGGRDVRNLNIGGNGSYVLGRVLVF